MAANKTRETDQKVEQFLSAVTPDRRRADGFQLLEMMTRISGESAKMWGPSLVGFGKYHYKYDSGREGDAPLTAFSPRKASLVLYLMGGFDEYQELMDRLGKHKTGKACLYINKLDDIDLQVLEQLISLSLTCMREKYC